MKTTAAALDFAAVMAQASPRVQGFEHGRPGLSIQTLKAAQDAWAWAKAHPDVRYRQPPTYAPALWRRRCDGVRLGGSRSCSSARAMRPTWCLAACVPETHRALLERSGRTRLDDLAHHRKLLPESPGPFSLRSKLVPARITALWRRNWPTTGGPLPHHAAPPATSSGQQCGGAEPDHVAAARLS